MKFMSALRCVEQDYLASSSIAVDAVVSRSEGLRRLVSKTLSRKGFDAGGSKWLSCGHLRLDRPGRIWLFTWRSLSCNQIVTI